MPTENNNTHESKGLPFAMLVALGVAIGVATNNLAVGIGVAVAVAGMGALVNRGRRGK